MPEDMMVDGMIMNSKPSSEQYTENHIEQIDLITSDQRTDRGIDTAADEPYSGR